MMMMMMVVVVMVMMLFVFKMTSPSSLVRVLQTRVITVGCVP